MTGRCSLKVLKIRPEIIEMTNDAADYICMKLNMTVNGKKCSSVALSRVKTNLKNADRSACLESKGILAENK